MTPENAQNLIKKILILFVIFIIISAILPDAIVNIIWIIFVLYFIWTALNIKNKERFKNIFSSRKNRDYIDVDPSGKKFSNMVNLDSVKKIPLIAAGLIILILLAIKMIVVIPAGTTGVYSLFGKVKDNEISSGLHIINPFASITKMSIRTEEYTMSSTVSEGKLKGNDAIQALTKEGLDVGLDITVLYHLEEKKASDVYKDIDVNYEEKIIRPEIRAAIREIAANYNAADIYTEKRTEFTDKIQGKLKNVINPRGIIVESVLLRNVSLPSGLTKSIEVKLQADQESQQMEFVLTKEEKEAERKRIQAAGQRDAQKIINESLTDKYLEYLYINELKDRQGTIYVPMSPTSGMPMFKSIP
ncbi:MAG: prohibitin family protein [bacterium]